MFSPLRHLVQRTRTALRRGRPSKARRGRHLFRPRLEGLEDRTVLDAVHWLNPVSGNWSAAGNWSPHAPGTGDTAILDATGANYTVTLDTNATVEGFTLASPGATFFASGQTFVVNGPGTLTAGTVLWRGSTWGGTGTLTNHAGMTIQGTSSISSPLEQDGSVRIQGSAAGSHAALTVVGGSVNHGTIVPESLDSRYNATLAGSFSNAADGAIQVNAGTGGGRSLNGDFTNLGAVNVGRVTTLAVNTGASVATFTNRGQVAVDPTGLMTVAGTYDAAGGAVAGPGYVNGTLRVSADAPTTILVGGNSTLATDNPPHTTVWVQGSNALGHATLTVANGVSNHGTILLQSTDGIWDDTLAAVGGGTFSNAADGTVRVGAGTGGGRSLTGTFTNLGSVNVGAGTTLTVNGGTSAATFTNRGQVTVSPTGLMTVGQTFTNNGTVNVPDGGTLNLTGTFTNFNAGSSTLTGGAYLIAGTFRLPSANIVTNSATLVLDGGDSNIYSGAGGTTNALAGFATNNGSFTLANGRDFTTAGDFTNNGTLAVAPGVFAVQGNYTQGAAGTLSVALDGTGPGGDYGQLAVRVTATLAAGATLDPTLGFVSANGDSFTVLSAAGGVSGTFNGLPDGAAFVLAGERFRANYPAGGVVLSHFGSVATHLSVVAPATATAGVPFDVTVQAFDDNNQLDTDYTGTVHFRSADPYGAGLPADYLFQPGDGGQATFAAGATLYTAGTWDVTATDAGDGALSGSAEVTVRAGAASQLVLTAGPAVQAGVAFAVTLTAYDAYGNVATGYTGTVSLSSSDPRVTGLLVHAFSPADHGTFTFTTAVLFTAGPQSLSADDGTLSGGAEVTVRAGAGSQLVLSAAPEVSAGSSFAVTVTAYDAYGNVAAGYLGTVMFTSDDPAGLLPDDYAFLAEDAGSHAFAVTLNTPGPVRLTVGDAALSAFLDLTVL
jgi:hypothetical protein